VSPQHLALLLAARAFVGPPRTVLYLLGVFVLAGGAILALAGRRRRHASRAARFARGSDLRSLRVRRAQPSRLVLGVHERALIATEPRASTMVIGPSESGKTRGLVVPALLERDGPVLCTSVKSDVLYETHAARAARGEVHVFDPTGASGLPHSPWSPLAASQTWTAARRTASRLLGVGDHSGARSADEAFWKPAGARFLAPLLLAAAHGDLAMREVLSWVARTEQQEPTRLLEGCRDPGAQAALEALRSVWEADARFRSSLTQTVATALDAWQEPAVAAASIGQTQITAEWLLSGSNTLYLVAPADEQRRLTGLFCALVSHIVAGAFAAAARRGKPLDPALLLALDELANIAPLPNVDELASTGRGQGVQLLSVFQNLSQAAERFGRERAETIVANHRARVFTTGIGDRATLEYLKHTLGDQEVARVARHRHGPLAAGSRTLSSEFRALAAPNRVREQQPDTALLIYGRLAPAFIALRPWYANKRLRRIAAVQEDPTPKGRRVFALPDFRRHRRCCGPDGAPLASSASPRRTAAGLGCVKETTTPKEGS
jgi:type IV secretion system protein VirD4